jgi:hypothetical protein
MLVPRIAKIAEIAKDSKIEKPRDHQLASAA